jgi:pimeloyl-ACP methyl ester carboxylesterase
MAAIRQDRFAYLTAFYHDFYNLDTFLGNRIGEEVVRDSWNVAAGASPVGTLRCVPTWLTDFRPDLAKIDVPTLVLHGDADRILPIAATGGPRLAAAIPGSRLVVVEGAPHGLLWTHADEVNRALLDLVGYEALARAA